MSNPNPSPQIIIAGDGVQVGAVQTPAGDVVPRLSILNATCEAFVVITDAGSLDQLIDSLTAAREAMGGARRLVVASPADMPSRPNGRH